MFSSIGDAYVNRERPSIYLKKQKSCQHRLVYSNLLSKLKRPPGKRGDHQVSTALQDGPDEKGIRLREWVSECEGVSEGASEGARD